MEGQPGEYRCLTCGHTLEKFTGEGYVAYRLTVQAGIAGSLPYAANRSRV